MTRPFLYAVVLCALCGSMAQAETIYYVDDDAPPAGNGATWNSAFRYLQDALAAAGDGDLVLVGRGSYRPSQSDFGNEAGSFALTSGALVKGGYGGLGANDPFHHDPSLYGSILWATPGHPVVIATGTVDGTRLEGFVVRDGQLNDDGLGAGLFMDGGHLTVHQCRFFDNSAEFGGGMYVRSGTIAIDQCVFDGNEAYYAGGGLRALECPAVTITNSTFTANGYVNKTLDGGAIALHDCDDIEITDCRIEDNFGGSVGGMEITSGEDTVIRRCAFNENTAELGIGALTVGSTHLVIADCVFRENVGGLAGGGMAGGCSDTSQRSMMINCEFIGNVAEQFGGGCIPGGNLPIINCVFYRNVADVAGGMLTTYAPVINCTFVENEGGGLASGVRMTPVRNCIFWNNTPVNITTFISDPEYVPAMRYSCIGDGYPGTGNIDADPLFVQPGTRNFRLAFGSPCLDAADTASVPADTVDLDDDGNVTEPIPVDLPGDPRIQNGAVDMGAYEGAFAALPPAAMNDDFDAGEATVLSPTNQSPGSEDALLVYARNMSSMSNATILVTDLRDPSRGAAPGASMIRIETDIPAGELLVRSRMPFDLISQGAADPLIADLTRRDDSSSAWVLATAGNINVNPTYAEPIGMRHIVEGGSIAPPSDALGDYGVYWNPSTQRGYVWANTDGGGDFSLRFGACPADSEPYGGDHVIDIFDLLALIEVWGAPDRWSDANGDGVVNAEDLVALLDGWGVCGD